MVKHLHELIKVCHKYEVSHVFPTLSKLVKCTLTVENCCDYYKWTIDFPPVIDDWCASDISNFFRKKFSEVVDTDGFMRLAHTHPVLEVELVRYIIAQRAIRK